MSSGGRTARLRGGQWWRAPVVALAAAAWGCIQVEDLDAPWRPDELEVIFSLEHEPGPAPVSQGNRVADHPAAAELGRRLFFDAGLSRSGELACASCHQPERYFTDGRRQGRGFAPLPHNTPSVVGAAYFEFLTWNGRRDSLWAQALVPIESSREMGRSRTGVAHHVFRRHREAYEGVFGPMPPLDAADRFPPEASPLGGPGRRAELEAWRHMRAEDRVAVERVFTNVGKALEAYERRLLPGPAPFDRYVAALREGDLTGGGHLSPGARRGLRLFIGRAGCVGCHHGPMLTDRQFHNLGLPPPPMELEPRAGRSAGARLAREAPFRCGSPYSDSDQARCDELRYLDPALPELVGAFKTPSLRNVAETGPYMHAGQFLTLDEVVEFYRRLPGQPLEGRRDPLLRKLGPGVPTRELVLFLRSLTGPLPEH